MNPGYVQALQIPGQMLDRYGGPVGLAGKLVGLSSDEVEAGIPWWSWCAVGVLAGGVLAYAARHKIERVFSD